MRSDDESCDPPLPERHQNPHTIHGAFGKFFRYAVSESLVNREGYALGLSYESSPADDEDRSFDLPVDELVRFAASYSWTGKRNLDYSLGASLVLFGDTKIDNTVQGVRVKGEFDSNHQLFLGGTLRYVF